MINDINRTLNIIEVRLNGKLFGTYINMNTVNEALRKHKINYKDISLSYGTVNEKQHNEMFWKLLRNCKVEVGR